MGKEDPNKTISTRSGNRNYNKKDQHGSNLGKNLPNKDSSENLPLILARSQRQSKLRLFSSSVPRLGAGSAPAPRTPLQRSPANNSTQRWSSNSPKSGSKGPPSNGSTLSKGKKQVPTLPEEATDQSQLQDKVQLVDNSQCLVTLAGSQSIEQNSHNMAPPAGQQSKTKGDIKNSEMWEAVMAKLDAMQTQQSADLQGIREQIQETNSGFIHDISQLRGELHEVKDKLQSHEATWDLEKIKRDILTEVVTEVKELIGSEIIGQVSSQMEESVKSQIASQAPLLEGKIKDQVASRVDRLEKEVDEVRQESRDNADRTEEGLSRFSQEVRQDSLREKCHNRRFNLILMGLPEQPQEEDEKERVAKIFKDRLSVQKPKIDDVYRLGKRSEGKRPRPIMISFSRIAGRKSVWYNKSKLNEDQEIKLRLQEDLPPELRWELSMLLKIQRQAKSLPELYPEVRIKDFKIIINGYADGVDDEDILPEDLRLAAIATPRSNDAVAFFGRDSPFSNHHMCEFESGGHMFNCMEQYLACHKAKIANNRGLVTKIMRASDPAVHKRALNTLKEAVADKWKDKVEDILIEGLRAKFGQNEYLGKILIATSPRRIGEASRDPIWGTGFPLYDDKVLDVEAWNEEGNLLGRSLEKVRDELMKKQDSAFG